METNTVNKDKKDPPTLTNVGKKAKKKVAKDKESVNKTKPEAVNAVVGTLEMFKVNPKKLYVEWENNPRENYGDIKSLENSIVKNGVENPVRVKKLIDGTIKLEAGYRRVRACLNLIKAGKKIPYIPAIMENVKTSNKQSLVHVFVENDGKPFNPMEEAILFERMKTQEKMSDNDIADNIGRSKILITRRLSLLKCSPEVQKALRGDDISLRTALRIIKAFKNDHKGQNKLLEDFISNTSEGDKESSKKARAKVAKASGIKNNTDGVTLAKAKTLLDDLAVKFVDYSRSKKSANSMNKTWVELEEALKNVRFLKRKGKFK